MATINSHGSMSSVTFIVSLALAIAFTSFGSTAAAPAVAPSFCETECKEGQFCDENSVSPSCTPCWDCAAVDRAPGLGNCAKSEAECGECLEGFMEIQNECTVNGTEGMDEDFQIPDIPGGPGTKTGPRTPSSEDKDAGTTKDSGGFPDGHPSASSVNWLRIIVVTSGVLAVIVFTVVCALGRRPSSLTPGGGWWPKRPRIQEEPSVQFQRDVPGGNELDRDGSDGEAELYDPNDLELVENEGHAELERLFQDALNPVAVVSAQVQKPDDPNPLGDEASVLLDPHGALDLRAKNVPEMGTGDGPDGDNHIDAAAVPEDEEQNAGVERLPDSGTHSEDEADRAGDEPERAGDENRVRNGSGSGNESGIGEDEVTAHHVPQSPLSPATQTAQLAASNPIASSSNSYAHRLQNLNVNPTEIANREEEERIMGYKSLPHYIGIRRQE